MLIFVDSSDRLVPPDVTLAATRDNPRVTCVITDGGGHTGSWNTGQTAYERQVRLFLRQVLTRR